MEGRPMASTGKTIPTVPHGDFSWQKSSYSNPNGECVELTRLPGEMIGVRHSQHPNGSALILSCAEIASFIQGIKSGHFDAPTGRHGVLAVATPGRTE